MFCDLDSNDGAIPVLTKTGRESVRSDGITSQDLEYSVIRMQKVYCSCKETSSIFSDEKNLRRGIDAGISTNLTLVPYYCITRRIPN